MSGTRVRCQPGTKKVPFYIIFFHSTIVSAARDAIILAIMVPALIVAGCLAPGGHATPAVPAAVQTSSVTVIDSTTPSLTVPVTVATPLQVAALTPNVTPPSEAILEAGVTKQAYPYAIRTKSQFLYLNTFDGVVHYLRDKYPDRPTDFYNPATLASYYQQYVSDPVQQAYLADFIQEIHDRSELPEKRVRIAVSLIQHIPYFATPRTLYPYEVLHYDRGKCDDKSILMAYVLSQMGYGTALFLYYPEHHMALGLRCPVQYSYNGSGYCFVETTEPSIMTYSNGTYVDVGKLTSTPGIIKISDGASFDQIGEEYTDARSYDTVINRAVWSGTSVTMDQIDYAQFGYLRQKYGLWDLDIRKIA